MEPIKDTNAKKARKLQTALIETWKEVEAMKETPQLPELENVFEQLKEAIQNEDMTRTRRHGTKLTALVTKFMIDKL